MHRFKDINNTNKCVRAYADPDSEDCLVKLLDFYIKKLPENPPGFYLRPLEHAPEDPLKPWYAKVKVGVTTLKGFLPEISEKVGIGVRLGIPIIRNVQQLSHVCMRMECQKKLYLKSLGIEV